MKVDNSGPTPSAAPRRPAESPAGALFGRDGDAFVATDLAQGGWDPHSANGGVVLGLLGHQLADVPTLVPMSLCRFTADIVRPVPLGRPLHVVPTVVREGKKIQVVQLLLMADGVEHVRATALRLRSADLSGRDDLLASTTDARPADDLVAPEESVRYHDGEADVPGFLRVVDMRQARRRDGTGVGVWLRLTVPVVEGEPMRPDATMTFVIDYANLIGVEDHATGATMINPDVTAHFLRPPHGEWVAITGDTRINPALARGVSSAELSDADGVFAVVSISQLVQPR